MIHRIITAYLGRKSAIGSPVEHEKAVQEQSALLKRLKRKEKHYTNLSPFVQAYVEAALWSSTDNSTDSGGEPMSKNYSPGDIAPETMLKMREDCQQFYSKNKDLVNQVDMGQAGHDFWLTRNGHGCGYWSRGDKKRGEFLTKAAESFGSFDLYIGDDGQIYGG